MRAAESMGEWERNGGTDMKYHETKHDETKPDETNKAKLTSIWRAQQAQSYRMDCMAKDRTLLTKQLP